MMMIRDFLFIFFFNVLMFNDLYNAGTAPHITLEISLIESQHSLGILLTEFHQTIKMDIRSYCTVSVN